MHWGVWCKVASASYHCSVLLVYISGLIAERETGVTLDDSWSERGSHRTTLLLSSSDIMR